MNIKLSKRRSRKCSKKIQKDVLKEVLRGIKDVIKVERIAQKDKKLMEDFDKKNYF